ncbi:hypothetical protein GMST_08600 [Geomonas silvestris]|uniref:Uncharacterized protein n=1 Tax=Geomonas silvestris TaxID=2740184 RepID=A0A6V8MEU9_9BACT|nr:hypothetical protein GMST_08600 [Geomonas silvestris]
MSKGMLVSLAAFRARRNTDSTTTTRSVEPALPDPGRLWELLDRNISIAVWTKVTEVAQQ